MTMQDKDQQFVDSIKSELNESVQNISARDLSAITQLRNKALSNKTEKKSAWVIVPLGAIATACLAVVVYSFIQMVADGQNAVDENLELVSVLESLDLYEDPDIYEELEFYEWLDAYKSSG
jgi:type VI protein secretion system component VasF